MYFVSDKDDLNRKLTSRFGRRNAYKIRFRNKDFYLLQKLSPESKYFFP